MTRTETDNGAGTRIHVAVWTSDEDRTLVAAESFGNVADMEGWIRANPAPPGEPPTIVWTDDLRRDPALAHALAGALGVPLPRRPPRRRRAAHAAGRVR